MPKYSPGSMRDSGMKVDNRTGRDFESAGRPFESGRVRHPPEGLFPHLRSQAYAIQNGHRL